MDEQERKPCNPHPKAPHGFLRNASHSLGRYVCECEYWEPEKQPAIVERAEESFDAAKQRGWVGLTDEEIYACDPQEECWNIDDVYKNIEAKLKEKNT